MIEFHSGCRADIQPLRKSCGSRTHTLEIIHLDALMRQVVNIKLNAMTAVESVASGTTAT